MHFTRFLRRSFTLSGRRAFSTATDITSKQPLTWNQRLKKIGLISSVGLGALILGFGYSHRDEANWRRSVQFWGSLYPIYVHYRYTDYKTQYLNYSAEERTAAFNILHTKYRDDIYNIIIQLKGFYIKLGQLGAARTDIIPEQWVEKLRLLEDECPSVDFHIISEIIRNEYGLRSINDVFEYIKPHPLGSASIGQAHYAILKDGREVVIKIQYPEVEGLFRGDFVMARKFCEMAQPAHLPFLDETEKQFLFEFDYRLEAENLELICNNINESLHWKHKCVVPQPIKQLCTQHVLVMDYLRGEKLITALKKNFGAVARDRGQTLEEFMEEQRLRGEHPSALKLEWYRFQIRSRDLVWNTLAFVMNHSFGLLFWCIGHPTHHIVDYKHTPIPLNVKYILDVVSAVHGYELFIDGAFNGDPHPGNILLLPDGRIGLIDYGQVKRLTLSQRLQLAKLMIYLYDNSSDDIRKQIVALGLRTKKMDGWVLEKSARMFFDCDDLVVTEGQNAQLFLEYLDKRDPVISLADDFVMAGRLRLLLAGLFHSLGYTFRAATQWKAYAQQILDENQVILYP